MRLSLICNSLSLGGAGRTASHLANGFAEDGWSVTVMTTDDGAKESIFDLAPEVPHVPLALEYASSSLVGAVHANIARARIMRAAILGVGSRLVISFLDRTNVLALLATRGLGIPVIVSERTDPGKRSIGLPWEILRHLTYTRTDALVCQGQRPLNSLPEIIRRRSCIIPNPVILPGHPGMGLHKTHVRTGPYKLVAMGTLKSEKGFDLLIRAFARVARDHPEWFLTVWGDGPDRKKLGSLSNELGVSDRIRLPGMTREPFSELAGGDLFILPSRVEGFPNALAEAMAMGLPVIATDVGAVSEMVRSGLDGIIVRPEDGHAMASAMGRLMRDGRLRCEMGRRAREVLDRFSLEKVLTMWKDLILKVMVANKIRVSGLRQSLIGIDSW